MGIIIDGRAIASDVKEEIKTYITSRRDNGLNVPKIVSILVGNDGGSIYYINSQEKVALSLGCDFEKLILEDTISQAELIEKIKVLNEDAKVSGIILQLPLPKGFDEKKVISAISEDKDIDCLTFANQGKLYCGEKTFLPCTPNSVLTLLERSNVELEGKDVVVIGRSNIVGKPAAQLLLNKNATVTICHSRTKDLKEICKRADIIVVAIGRPKFLTEEFVSEKSIVIDVGTSSVDGKITGDVDFDNVLDKVSMITKVPGGVGALTTTLLIKNACYALEKNEN